MDTPRRCCTKPSQKAVLKATQELAGCLDGVGKALQVEEGTIHSGRSREEPRVLGPSGLKLQEAAELGHGAELQPDP